MSSSRLYFRGNREGYKPFNRSSRKDLAHYEARLGHEVDEIDEQCAGCAVFSISPIDNSLIVMLTKHYGGWYWFPKGHVQEGEDIIDAAMRETLEEAGVTLNRDQVDPNGVVEKYTLFTRLHSDQWINHPDYPDKSKRPKVIAYKRVVLFAAFSDTPPTCTPQLAELENVAFYPIGEARRLLGQENEHQLDAFLQCDLIQEKLLLSKV